MTRKGILMGGLILALLLGCSGNPFRQFRLLAFRAVPTELPPEGGQVQVEVEATKGDGAEVKVIRLTRALVLGDDVWLEGEQVTQDTREPIGHVVFRMRPSNGGWKIAEIAPWHLEAGDDRDERLAEVIVKGRPLAGNP